MEKTTEHLERVENVYVTANDIGKIGNTHFKDEETGCLSIICNGNTVNIEEIFLRSILKCFGEQYVITDTEDYIWTDTNGNEVYDILIKTNLPGDLDFQENEKNFIRVKVDHSVTYSLGDGKHTNGIESFWAIVKRGVYGIYHHVSVDYMQRYMDEFCFRLNHRATDDAFNSLIRLTVAAQFFENQDIYKQQQEKDAPTTRGIISSSPHEKRTLA